MYIHEAIKARTEDSPFIIRKKWVDPLATGRCARLIPTSSPNCIIIDTRISSRTTSNLRRGWEPTAEDLVADDWETTPDVG